VTTPIEALRALVEAVDGGRSRPFGALRDAHEVLAAHDKAGTVVKVTECTGVARCGPIMGSYVELVGARPHECLVSVASLLPRLDDGAYGHFRISVEFTPAK
jgi:hypothetical protein